MLHKNVIEQSGFRTITPNELEAVGGGFGITVIGTRPGGTSILGGGGDFGTNGNETGNDPDSTLGDTADFSEEVRERVLDKDEDGEFAEAIERFLEGFFEDSTTTSDEWTFEYDQKSGIFQGMSSEGQHQFVFENDAVEQFRRTVA